MIEVTELRRIADYSVTEVSGVPFDTIRVDRTHRVVVCGEIEHFAYRVRMSVATEMLRLQVRQMLVDLAHSVGVDEQVISE